MTDAALLQELKSLLGKKGVLEEEHPLLPDIMLRPAGTDEVAAVVKLCHQHGQSLIPVGGKTGMAAGLLQIDDELGLSLERMNAIEEVDAVNRTMTVQAGCILQTAAEAAEEQGYLLPLDLGARGSATVGGNVATNAGGNRVIRYGMMREMVLGLEVVLADGTVVNSLNKMLKNNTGYDLKQWFIGAEGTLGIITRVLLRLRPLPRSQNTALVAVDDFESVTGLLRWLDDQTAGTLSAFECMWPSFYEFVTREDSLHTPPLAHGSPFYVLVETLGSDPVSDMERFETVLGQALEEGLIVDAVIASSDSQRASIWEIRDDVLEFHRLGPAVGFDVSVTLDRMEAFLDDVDDCMDSFDQPINVVFGHLGDCNLHVILGSRDFDEFDQPIIEDRFYAVVEKYAGSVSAEHGVGVLKRDHLGCSRSPEELRLMYQMKKMLDPDNILNPNKIFSADKLTDL